MKASLVFKNGVVYTADAGRTIAEAVAVVDGKIAYVGDNAGVQAYVSAETEVVDLADKMLLPSFFEGHAHYTKATSTVVGINLAGLDTEADYVAAMKQFLAERPGLQALRGQGYLEAVFPGIGPRKEALDEVSTEIPIVVQAETLHSLWCNSKAIELAGVTQDTPDPENGRIERNPDGSAHGCFRETAQDLILDAVGDFSVEQYKEGILAYQDMILQYGFTGAYDPWLYANGNAVEAIKELDQEGRLKIYFRGAYWMDPHRGPEQVSEIAAARERDNENAGMFEIRAVKFFMDGVLESLTAFLLEPYAQAEGRPEGWRGDQIWEPENMKKCVAAVDAAGMGIHVHCAGDAAVKQTLDAIEYAQSVAGKNDRRHCITHIFLVDPADLQRFKELGVVAMLNAYWAQIDETYFVNGTYTGAERIAHTFPVNSFFQAGVITANASDFPITAEPNPFIGIEIGVTRIAPDNYHPWVLDYDDPRIHGDFWPEERAKVEDMIDSFTIAQAYANFLDEVSGSLEVGKEADMIVVDRNILACPSEDVGLAQVERTIFRGQTLYQK